MPQSPLSRREFVHASSLALAAGVLGGASNARAQPEPAPMASNRGVIFKSVKFGMIGVKGSYEDKFKALKDLGYDGIECDSPSGHPVPAVRDAAAKVGLPIHGVVDSTHWNIRLSDPKPEVREKGLRDLLTAIRDCNALGGYSVLLVPGHGKDGTVEEVEQRSLEMIRMALPTAAKLGVRILLENVWNHMFYDHSGPGDQTADRFAAFIDRCNSPWVGAHYDVGNHRKYGVPSKWARTLGHRIAKLDLKDYNHTTQKWADIGEGTVDWAELRTVLKEIGYTGWAVAEVGGGDVARLKTIAEQMDRVLDL